jgi:hypothetical protein
MGGVTVTLVHVVDVVLVGYGDVTASLTMSVVVAGVLDVLLSAALIGVRVVNHVYVPVVKVVGVVSVGDRHMPTPRAVDVRVPGMLETARAHVLSSCECLTASLTMWATCSSTSS